jgi:hypothetical protein
MPVRKNIVFPARFYEWFFDLLTSIPKEIRRSLNDTELSALRTKSEIKRFAQNSIIDKKLTLLTKLGLDWSLIVFDPKKFDIKTLEKVYRQYSINGAPLDNINDMIRQQVFVLSSKEIALSLGMMASNCHGNTFRINMEITKVNDALAHIDKRREMAESNQSKQSSVTDAAYLRMARMMFYGMDAENYFLAVHGLLPVEVKILCILYQKPNNYYRVTALQERLKHSHQPTTVAARARILFEQNYLERLPVSTKTPSYQIKAKGILALCDYLNRMANQSGTEI